MSHRPTSPHTRIALKLPEFHGKVRGLQLACSVGVLVCAQACLVPQNVEPIKSVDATPRFALSSFPTDLLDTPIIALFRQGSKDATLTPPCHCEIEIPPLPFEEDDPTVEVTVRWFLDYELAVPRSLAALANHGRVIKGTFDDPTATLRTTDKFDFDADALGIATSGIHRLDVVVGETAAFDPSSDVALPNRTPAKDFQLAEFSFIIDVHVEQSVQQCPAQLPSIRVCQ